MTDVKRTLFSVGLLSVGFAFGGFGTGDGIAPPPPGELKARNEKLAAAKVLRTEPFVAANVDFAADPNRGVINPQLTTCKYDPDAVSGTSPKFDCELENGDKIKVKYGWTNEIPSEIVATRLLHGLGFGADRVSPVETVRCYGCPFQPFHTRSLAELLGLDDALDKSINYSKWRDFKHVSAERKLEGEAIEAGDERGWGFYELKRIDSARGGATKDEVDALRLAAVFIHHWDNKTSNQRLVCEGAKSADCKHPLAMLQDVGADFGPKRVNVEKWQASPVWADEATCVVSMKHLPYGGGTFEDVQISEGGRRLLGDRLKQLSASQIEALFRVAGLDDVPRWVSAFQDKVRQVSDRKSCPL
jgi:hypothetical protein